MCVAKKRNLTCNPFAESCFKGTTQGDPIALSMYEIAIIPIIATIAFLTIAPQFKNGIRTMATLLALLIT